MFNMKKGKDQRKATDYAFDLENDLKDPAKLKAFKQQMEEKVNQIKSILRQGEDKKMFDDAQTLLHGYLSVQKVIQRLARKMD